MLPTTKPHRPNWDQGRLGTYFVRDIKRSKAPVGRVYEDRDSKGQKTGTHRAEIEEVVILVLYNPKTKASSEIIIDPRHPQSRDHLKIAQDVVEGRLGGLTPVRLAVERTAALDPEGKEIAETDLDRIAEMESPAMTRGQTSVSAFGKRIGEWTPELDSAVDKAASLRAVKEAAAFLSEVETGAEAWGDVQARARAKLAQHWAGQIPDEALAAKIGLYEPQSPKELFDGRFVDGNGREVQGAYDATREAPPEGNRTAEAQFFYQQALVETFAERMQVQDGGLLEATQGEMMHEGLIPVKKPGVDPKIEAVINYEKARAVGAHVLGGYQLSRGAAVLSPRLAEELSHESALHSDLDSFMEAAGLGEEQRGEHYLGVARVRGHLYHEDAKKGAGRVAEKCIKTPEDQRKLANAKRAQELASGAHKFAEHHWNQLKAIPEALEGHSFM